MEALVLRPSFTLFILDHNRQRQVHEEEIVCQAAVASAMAEGLDVSASAVVVQRLSSLLNWTAVVQVGASALVAASSAVTLVPAATGFTLPDRSSICGG